MKKTDNNPTEWRQLTLSEVEKYRHLNCTNYENCLDIADLNKWQGFKCSDCTDFKGGGDTMMDEEIIEEIIGFLKECELPQENTIYWSSDCHLLVKESVKVLFKTINDLKKEKECTVKKVKAKPCNATMYSGFLKKWNEQGMIQHYKVTTKRKAAIDKVLRNKDYTVEEIFKAFQNYAKILKSSDYFWDYKWTMEDFLNRGLHKFVDEAKPFDNNKNTKPKPATNSPYENFSCC